MDIFQIVGLGIVATVLITVIKGQRPEIAVQVSIVTGVVIFLLLVSKLSGVITLLTGFTRKVNMDSGTLTSLVKIIGIAYIAEFGAEICKDAGEGAIASKIELAGKVIIAVMAVPIIGSLLELVIGLMP